MLAFPVPDISVQSVETAQTPLMRQYAAAKQQHPDALLFFRLGDFYELFFEDAHTASRELQITLTARDKERAVPMCGVPYHAAEGYIARLLRKGYRIAICEQMEDPKLTKKIVRREVTRVLTPGTALDSSLSSEQNNFLASLFFGENIAALALLDLSTGDFRAAEFSGPQAASLCFDELQKASASEVLFAGTNPMLAHKAELPATFDRIKTKTPLEDWVFTRDYAVPLLERQLGAASLDGFGLSQHPAAAIAAGAILHYAQNTQRGELGHIDSIRFYERAEHLQLDQVTVRNLELIEPIFSDSGSNATLFHTLDACQTPMGKRLLRASILRPLFDEPCINQRYEAVDHLRHDLILREEIRKALGGILDLERLLARISLDSAGPRDLLALSASLQYLPQLQRTLAQIEIPLWRHVAARLDPLEELCTKLQRAIQPSPPLTLAEGGVIAAGIDAELDELRTLSQSGRQSIAAIEERERARTGIGSLKVRFNSVFGYYIEITKSNLAHVPSDYERKQTLVNAERFTTPELKDYETKILTAHERSVEIEKRIFGELRRSVLDDASRIRKTGSAVAEADLLANFAHLAALRNYVRPQLVQDTLLELAGARHPVIECLMEDAGEGRFVPNDLYLDVEASAILLLTGPNMGGKSTYLRQAAMLVIMAQMGCFVPSASMRYGLVDRVYTRIGASDNVARGRSTFMVEMTETATILNTATARSLILLDEMGRGTATFDGLSLAWATLEYLHAHIGARTLFATHYHELTMLAEQLDHLKNLSVAVKDTPKGIFFLHSIEPGPASKSYGIDVARLAGLPPQVIQRARQVLKQHERSERHNVAAETEAPLQLTMFTPLSQRILDRLQETDINSLTPLQALNLLEELQSEIASSQGGKA
ncbi:DNA mismatch repair protein MutS [Acidobacterium sp. S8]|uniref:DNA mismatch repair protein MutS n=1 Tax=Acidobacterium sp. S8 TaxID=1641854 RepID=UPI00131D4DFC|nr:DNA mismatch repair protein MutS [Acidobacterium sp. S8]